MGLELIIQGEGTIALGNSSVQGTLIDPAAIGTVYPGTLKLGDVFILRASGIISNIITTPGTVKVELMFGDIPVFATGDMPMNIVAKTNVQWFLDAHMALRAVGTGTTAKFLSQGRFISHSNLGAPAVTVGGAPVVLLPYNAVPALGAGFNSESWHHVDLQGKFSIADPGNEIRCLSYSFVKLS